MENPFYVIIDNGEENLQFQFEYSAEEYKICGNK